VLWVYRPNNQADDEQAKRSADPQFVFRKGVHLTPR
jgi:hypothetical protein